MPTFKRSSLGIEAWVIVEGWHTSDSTPPRLSASDMSFSDLKKVEVVFVFKRKGDHRAAVLRLAPVDRVAGVVQQTGIVDPRYSVVGREP